MNEAELLDHLTRPAPPWIVTASPPTWGVVRSGLGRHEGIKVAEVSGRRARTKSEFLTAAARALRFPDYFGENWDAFEECVRDLEWLPARAYVLAVTDAEHLLADDPKDRKMFMTIAENAALEWAARHPSTPFHLVLVTSTAS